VSLLRKVALVKRSSLAGTMVKGRYVDGETVDTPFLGTAQPPTGRMLQNLPEGKRENDIMLFYAPINLDFTTVDNGLLSKPVCMRPCGRGFRKKSCKTQSVLLKSMGIFRN
jgi:hypothetical protein